MDLFSSEKAFYLIERISAVRQSLFQAGIFREESAVDKVLLETLDFIKISIKKLILLEENTKK